MLTERRVTTSLAKLAELVGGSVSGDPSISVSGVAPLELAGADHVGRVDPAAPGRVEADFEIAEIAFASAKPAPPDETMPMEL